MADETEAEETANLNSTMASILIANQAMEASLKTANEMAADSGNLGRNTSKSIYSISDKVPGVGKVMRAVGKEITSVFKTGFKLQERALARGLNFDSLREQVQPMTDSLHSAGEGLTDAMTAFEIGTEAWEGGLRTNNKAVGKLALQTKLTGGNSAKLLKQLAQNTAGMGMNEASMTSLAKRTQGLSQNFGMSTEELVDAMAGLGSDLNELATLGLGADMQEATATLAAALGPEMSGMAPDIVKALTSGGTMIQNSMLGGAEEIANLVTAGYGDKSSQTLDALMKLGSRAEEISSQYADGSMHSRFAMDQAVKVFGKQMPLYARAYKQLQEAAREQGVGIDKYVRTLKGEQKVRDEFQDTWDNVKKKIFDPFISSLMEWVKPVLQWLVDNKGFARGMLQVATAIGGLLVALKGLQLTIAAAQFTGGLFKGGGFKKFLFGKGAAGAAAGAAGAAGGGAAEAVLEGAVGGAAESVVPQAAAPRGPGMLERLGDGLKSLGDPKAMKGALTIGVLALSLIPLAAAMFIFSQIKDIGAMFAGLAAGVLALAAVATIMAFLAPFITVGLPLIYALSVAVLILAGAMALGALGMTPFIKAVSKLTFENAVGILAIGASMGALALSLILIGTVGWFGILALWTLEGRIESLAKQGTKIHKLTTDLRELPTMLDKISSSLATISLAPFNILAKGLSIVKTALDGFDMRKLVNMEALQDFSNLVSKVSLDLAKVEAFGGAATAANMAAGVAAGEAKTAALSALRFEKQMNLLQQSLAELKEINDNTDKNVNETRRVGIKVTEGASEPIVKPFEVGK